MRQEQSVTNRALVLLTAVGNSGVEVYMIASVYHPLPRKAS